MSVGQRCGMVSKEERLSIRRQCVLLGLCRATFYYTPASESDENLKIMELLDSQYAETPFYGYRRLMALLKAKGHDVSANRLRRLMCMAQREAGVRVREPLPYFRLLQQPPPAPKPWLPVSRDGLHEETGGMILMIGIMDIPDKDTFFH